MNNRSKIVSNVVLVALGLGGVSAALAGPAPHAAVWEKNKHRSHYGQHEQFARVVDVDPIVRRVRVSVPEQQCWSEEQAVRSGPSRSEVRGTIIGGLIGAVVGHQVSSRQGVHTPSAMIGGSLIGAAIGNGVGSSKGDRRGEYVPVRYRDVERCEVSYRDAWEERIDGYEVTYVYNGRKYTTMMPYDPGRQVRVDVNVRPVYDRY
jgi:uncharacterized protein YcfJ